MQVKIMEDLERDYIETRARPAGEDDDLLQPNPNHLSQQDDERDDDASSDEEEGSTLTA